MNRYKEFQGKSLDDAIKEACGYYGVEREKLEIEIVSDAKSGIFGLVGAKKATIRAARVQLADNVSRLLDTSDAGKEAESVTVAPTARSGGVEAGRRERRGGEEKRVRTSDPELPGANSGPGADEGPAADTRSSNRSGTAKKQRDGKEPRRPRGSGTTSEADGSPGEGAAEFSRKQGESGRRGDKRPPKSPVSGSGGSVSREAVSGSGTAQRGRRDREERQEKPESGFARERRGGTGRTPALDFLPEHAPELVRDELPEFPLDGCDQEGLFVVVREVVLRLIEPIVGEAPCTVEIRGNRVRASLDCGSASGLLVGREGQTLAAIQYLAARIIARRIGGSLRLQIDAGNYRERQDDRLKEMALALAARAKATQRSQATRPLSAYQRRVIHLALEHDDTVQTHSKGEGMQRRVIIHLKRPSGRYGDSSGTAGPEFAEPESTPDVFEAAPSLESSPAFLHDNGSGPEGSVPLSGDGASVFVPNLAADTEHAVPELAVSDALAVNGSPLSEAKRADEA